MHCNWTQQQSTLGYVAHQSGFLASLEIQYSCSLWQTNTQKEREINKIQGKAKPWLLAKWKRLLPTYICYVKLFLPKLKRTIKIKILAATSQCTALSHILIASFPAGETLGKGWEGMRFLDSVVSESSETTALSPGVKPFFQRKRVFEFLDQLVFKTT